MIKHLEVIRWEYFFQRKLKLIEYGLENNLIDYYDDKFISQLRKKSIERTPLSIILLSFKLCNRKCYSRAVLAAFGFEQDDFYLMDAKINSISWNPENIKYAKDNKIPNFGMHRVAVRKKNNQELVYDTTLGLVVEKNLYDKIENPRNITIYDKETSKRFMQNQKVEDFSIFNQDLTYFSKKLEFLNNHVVNSNEINYSLLTEEITKFENKVNKLKKR